MSDETIISNQDQTRLINLVGAHAAEKYKNDQEGQFAACARAFEAIAADLSGKAEGSTLSNVVALKPIKEAVKVLKDAKLEATVFQHTVTKTYLENFPDSKAVWAKHFVKLWSPELKTLDFKVSAQLVRSCFSHASSRSIGLLDSLCKNPNLDKSILNNLFLELIKQLQESKVDRVKDLNSLTEVINKNHSLIDFNVKAQLVCAYIAHDSEMGIQQLDRLCRNPDLDKSILSTLLVEIIEHLEANNINRESLNNVIEDHCSLIDPFDFSIKLIKSNCFFESIVNLIHYLAHSCKWEQGNPDMCRVFYQNIFSDIVDKMYDSPQSIPRVLAMRASLQEALNVPPKDCWDKDVDLLLINHSQLAQVGARYKDNDAEKIVYYLSNLLEKQGVLETLPKADLKIFMKTVGSFISNQRTYSKKAAESIDTMIMLYAKYLSARLKKEEELKTLSEDDLKALMNMVTYFIFHQRSYPKETSEVIDGMILPYVNYLSDFLREGKLERLSKSQFNEITDSIAYFIFYQSVYSERSTHEKSTPEAVNAGNISKAIDDIIDLLEEEHNLVHYELFNHKINKLREKHAAQIQRPDQNSKKEHIEAPSSPNLGVLKRSKASHSLAEVAKTNHLLGADAEDRVFFPVTGTLSTTKQTISLPVSSQKNDWQEPYLEVLGDLEISASKKPLETTLHLIDLAALALPGEDWQKPFLRVLGNVLVSPQLDSQTFELAMTLIERESLQAQFKDNSNWKLMHASTIAPNDPLEATKKLIDLAAIALPGEDWQKPFLRVLGNVLVSPQLDSQTFELARTLIEREDLRAKLKNKKTLEGIQQLIDLVAVSLQGENWQQPFLKMLGNILLSPGLDKETFILVRTLFERNDLHKQFIDGNSLEGTNHLIDLAALTLQKKDWQKPFLIRLRKMLHSRHLGHEMLALAGTLFEREDLQIQFKDNSNWKLMHASTIAPNDPLEATKKLIDLAATPLQGKDWQEPFLKVLERVLHSRLLDNDSETLALAGTVFELENLQAQFKDNTLWKLMLFSTIDKKIERRTPDALLYFKEHRKNSPLDTTQWLSKLEAVEENFPKGYLQPFYDILLDCLLENPNHHGMIRENPSLRGLLTEKIEKRLCEQTKDAKTYLTKYWKLSSYTFKDWLEKLRTIANEKKLENPQIIPFYEALIKSAPNESVSYLIHLSEKTSFHEPRFFQLLTLILRAHPQNAQVIQTVGELFELPSLSTRLGDQGRWKGLLLLVIDSKISNNMPGAFKYFNQHWQETPYSQQEWLKYFTEKKNEGLSTDIYSNAFLLDELKSKMPLPSSDLQLEDELLDKVQDFLTLHKDSPNIIDHIGTFFKDKNWVAAYGLNPKAEHICLAVIEGKIWHSAPDALDYFKTHFMHTPYAHEQDWNDFVQKLKNSESVKKSTVDAFEVALKVVYSSKERQSFPLSRDDSFGSYVSSHTDLSLDSARSGGSLFSGSEVET